MPIKQLKTPHKRKEEGKKEKKKRGSILQFFITIIIFGGLIGAISLVAFIAIVSRDLPNTDGLVERVVPESTKIYDSSGQTILYQIHGDEKRTEIDIDQLPDHVSNAFIAIEDKDFYKHNGLIPKRVVKAVYDDIMYTLKTTFIPKFVRDKLNIRLNKVQGASTITQQLVKNAILTPEKKVTRKLKEMILSWQLEKKFTKKQILKMYLNEIPYGGVNYGVESAAQSYFAKSAKDLTVAESATLAALINSPTRLSPYGNHRDELIDRQRFVLSLMHTQGLIDDATYDAAKNEELQFKVKRETILAPHFVMYVRQLLEEDFGTEYSEQLLKEGGLKIYTTLDIEKQELAEKILSESKEHLEENGASNAALVAVDPKNGNILAMVGAVDYFDTENDGNFNASLGLRQPGSSIKPLIYTAAFQKGYSPETVLYDVETNFNAVGGSYRPRNYNLKELGPVTIRKALAGSLNIPAVKALYLVGLDTIAQTAQKVGYTTLSDKDRYGLSLVLGGAEVKLLEHVLAYGSFANDGNWNPGRAILRIEDRDGNIIKEYGENEQRVWDANAARMINSILSDNQARAYAFGLNNPLVVKDKIVAAKTGTTNDYRDAWTVGYTPSLVVGVWAGNNNNDSMTRGSGGGKVAAPLWNAFMSEVLKDQENETFASYPPNTSNKPVLNGSLVDGYKVRVDTVTGKLATENTPEELVEEKVFRDMHSILHYINKDDPNGNPPEDPSADPQYKGWESAINIWLEEYNKKANENEDDDIAPIEVSEPPTEYDDVHLPENIPQIEIISPAESVTISDSLLNISINTSSARGVDRVSYFIDDAPIGVSFSHPYNYSYEIIALQNGFHTLKSKSCDGVQNCAESEVKFNLLLSQTLAPVTIMGPQNGSSFYQTSFPLTMSFDVKFSNTIAETKVYSKKVSDNSIKYIGQLENILDGFNTLKWNENPESGDYLLYVEVIDNDGNISRSRDILVTVL